MEPNELVHYYVLGISWEARPVRFVVIASIACTLLVATPVRALPIEPIAAAPNLTLAKGGHGNHGRHLGWVIGRHRGWSHSHHRMH
jgi:hypothetical protein